VGCRLLQQAGSFSVPDAKPDCFANLDRAEKISFSGRFR
jgi:hypothetical protein